LQQCAGLCVTVISNANEINSLFWFVKLLCK
jgi:hypothetical protein